MANGAAKWTIKKNNPSYSEEAQDEVLVCVDTDMSNIYVYANTTKGGTGIEAGAWSMSKAPLSLDGQPHSLSLEYTTVNGNIIQPAPTNDGTLHYSAYNVSGTPVIALAITPASGETVVENGDNVYSLSQLENTTPGSLAHGINAGAIISGGLSVVVGAAEVYFGNPEAGATSALGGAGSIASGLSGTGATASTVSASANQKTVAETIAAEGWVKYLASQKSSTTPTTGYSSGSPSGLSSGNSSVIVIAAVVGIMALFLLRK